MSSMIDTLAIAKQLQEAGDTPQHAEALANILGRTLQENTVTKHDLREAVAVLDRKIDEKFGILDHKIDEKFGILDHKIDEKFGILDHKIDEKFGILDRKIDEKINQHLHATIGWMIGLIGALGAFIHFVH